MNPIVKSGQEWTFPLLDEVATHIERIAVEKYDLNLFDNQIEIISSEQMLDAYAANGLPIFYAHWSFGQQFVKQLNSYQRGLMGLAYEVVINSDPCISYCMEENTMLMQTLVIAHAAMGHNTFFKNNYLFKEWTDPEGIIDYLRYAKKYVRECEEKHGADQVERVLNCAHALQMHGVDKYKPVAKLSAAQEEKRREERVKFLQANVNELWKTIPDNNLPKGEKMEKFPKESQENLVRFLEENAPRLKDWEREILRIVRTISQYFYPQMQTKMLNEAIACFWHYTIMHDLYEEGIVSADAMQEFYISHANVVYQPDFDSPHYSGINPYAIGFAMMQDVKRVAMDPTDEDRKWFHNQEWVGSGDWLSVIKEITAEYKDESGTRQFLSPTVMREFKLFDVLDDEDDPNLLVNAIHDDKGYYRVRDALAQTYNIGYSIPNIEVDNVERWGDRSLHLTHTMINNRPIDVKNAGLVIRMFSDLWGYDVSFTSRDDKGRERLKIGYNVKKEKMSLNVFDY